jgi:hypothetical protein
MTSYCSAYVTPVTGDQKIIGNVSDCGGKGNNHCNFNNQCGVNCVWFSCNVPDF